MIKLECTEVMGMPGAMRGMRNPMNSWDKSDSGYEALPLNQYRYVLGPNDLDLAQRLIKAGPDHRKFMRQIFVSVDLTAPLYYWKEYDTYKVGTTANSCSTMHKIHEKEFTLEDFSFDRTLPIMIKHCTNTIGHLNTLRELYIETKDKDYWYSMIQLLPSSYNQKRTCTLTYENLRNMYFARKNHKLDEWKMFTQWIESLPYAKELTMIE